MAGVDAILLMGPPGSGKSTLGNELHGRGIATYTELEPLIVEMFGQGRAFVPKRPRAHRWIREFYRQQLAEANLPVVIETTGISDREFLQELAECYALLRVLLTTSCEICLDRVRTRPKGHNVGAPEKPMAQFYDDWHSQTKPSYAFDLPVSGTDLEQAVAAIRAALDRP